MVPALARGTCSQGQETSTEVQRSRGLIITKTKLGLIECILCARHRAERFKGGNSRNLYQHQMRVGSNLQMEKLRFKETPQVLRSPCLDLQIGKPPPRPRGPCCYSPPALCSLPLWAEASVGGRKRLTGGPECWSATNSQCNLQQAQPASVSTSVK